MNESEYLRMFEAEDRHWWYVGLHDLILRTVAREYSAKGRLCMLDAGCGSGRLLKLLTPFGSVRGCDKSELALFYCGQRGLTDVFKADLNSAALGDACYDLITAIDVLYHKDIKDDSLVLRRLADALRPGGVLIMNLVAFEFIRSNHDMAVHTRKRYRRAEVVRLLKQAGLEVQTASYRLCLLFPFIATYRIMRRLIGYIGTCSEVASDVILPWQAINNILLDLLLLENRVIEKLSLPFGTSVFTVARRPVL